jgi:hypothetical protein
MAQRVVFNGRVYVEPTSQGRVVGGVNNAAAPLSFGNICLIDTGATTTTGLGAGYGYGKGALDSSGNGRQINDMVYRFDDPHSMREAVKGGIIWDLVQYLFNPSNGAQGASTVFLIRAAQTAAAGDTLTMNDGKTWIFTTKEEGTVCNGVEVSSQLSKGYAVQLTMGVVDPTKVMFKFFRGIYKGQDFAGFEFDGQTAAEASLTPQLVCQSTELTAASAAAEFTAWAATNEDFQRLFTWSGTSQSTGTGVIDTTATTGDVALLAGNNLFAGGTESYSSAAMDHVLASIPELDNSIFLAAEEGLNAAGTNNIKILSHVTSESDFKKHVVIGGGASSTNFATGSTASSIDSAATLNSELAILAHGGFTIPYSLNKTIDVPKFPIYKAAMVAGLMAGKEPQTPLTYKNLRVGKEAHQMTKTERIAALEGGVLHMKKHNRLGWIINQGINTLQANDYMINNDGTSPEISISRIKEQLNREISQSASMTFIGGNLYNASGGVIVEFVKSYLAGKLMVAGQQDGMIYWFGNVTAIRSGSTWNVSYDFQANSPINKIFTTGTILDASA